MILCIPYLCLELGEKHFSVPLRFSNVFFLEIDFVGVGPVFVRTHSVF